MIKVEGDDDPKFRMSSVGDASSPRRANVVRVTGAVTRKTPIAIVNQLDVAASHAIQTCMCV